MFCATTGIVTGFVDKKNIRVELKCWHGELLHDLAENALRDVTNIAIFVHDVVGKDDQQDFRQISKSS